MNKEEILKLQNGFFNLPRLVLAVIGVGAILLVCISPLIWIWHSWALAWRCFLSGLIICIITSAILKFIKKLIIEAIEDINKLNDSKPTTPNSEIKKSKFQIRLEQLAKERGYKLPTN